MSALDALTVARVIPKDTLLGLASGAYGIYGGVVRDAGGRIVAHLAMPATTAASAVPGLGWVADAFQTYQLDKMGLALEGMQTTLGTMMKVSTASLAVSGLGLGVSIAGFMYLAKKLAELKGMVERVERNTRKTQQMMEAIQYANLQSAMDDLRHAQGTADSNVRRSCLMQSKAQFGHLVHLYENLWPKQETVQELLVVEDSYTLAMVGYAVAASDLGLSDAATVDFARHHSAWRRLAREYCISRVLRDNPHRLLHHRHIEYLPARDLLSLMDFANGQRHGLNWLDHLRRGEADASILRLPQFGSEEEPVQFALKLVAKDDLLSGYALHFQFLAEQGFGASEFQSKVDTLTQGHTGNEPLWVCIEPPQTREADSKSAQLAEPIRVPWWRSLFETFAR